MKVIDCPHTFSGGWCLDCVQQLVQEREAIQNDERVLTCIYCGHQYEPGTPPSNHEALTAHIAQCDKHPMRAITVALTNLVDAVAEDPSINHAKVSHRLSVAMTLARQYTGSAH